jgi:hypothetical protein
MIKGISYNAYVSHCGEIWHCEIDNELQHVEYLNYFALQEQIYDPDQTLKVHKTDRGQSHLYLLYTRVVEMKPFVLMIANTAGRRSSCGCVHDTPAADHQLCNRTST